MYSKDYIEFDQIKLEDQRSKDADGDYIRFVGYLDPKGSWQIHIEDMNGNKLRVATVGGSATQGRIHSMIDQGKFNSGFKPEDIYRFLVEKW